MIRPTPSTSAERALEDMAYLVQARHRGQEPSRMPGFGALLIDGPLPPNHPLSDSPSEARRKRIAEERACRAPLRTRDPWW